MSAAPSTPGSGRLAWVAFFVSASVLGFEIVLMRVLLVASWHHFAFLVISIALLGFGASGTALCVVRRPALRHGDGALFALVIATAVSMLAASALLRHVSIEARFVPALLWSQVGRWLLYWLVLLLPFLFGGAVIGLSLMLARGRVAFVYGANLVGSGAGAMLAWIAMYWPAELLPVLASVIALPSVAGLRLGRRPIGVTAVVLLVAATALWLRFDRPRVAVDPYKYRAYVERLEEQGMAGRFAAWYGPRGTIEVFQSDVFHELPFLALDAVPPRVDALVVDGHWRGSLLRAETLEDAAAVDGMLTSVPYALIADEPAVLLLGEMSGVNVWLAARRGASAIHFVQPDDLWLDMLNGPLGVVGGRFVRLPGVIAVVADPRHFVERATRRYDLIQLAAVESAWAGSGGIGGLAEDHLVTEEGLTAALETLSPEGVLSVCRGIQSPPRDNVKILATITSALRALGAETPGDHVVVVRDYLAVCTIAKRTAWTAEQVERVRRVCTERGLTPVWFPGIRPDERNHPDVLPGPTDDSSDGDWYAHAADRMFSPDASAFIDQWMFDVRAPTDDRPFFMDFSRLRSIGTLREAFGDLWLTRAELAYLFVLAAAVVIVVVGAVLTLLPLLALRAIRAARGRTVTAAYFGSIGLAYLLLEMVVISRLTYLIGDPVTAAAVTIAAFLIFSGMGSLAAQRLTARDVRAGRRVIGLLLVVAVVEILVVLPLVGDAAGGLSSALRCVVGAGAIAPLAVLMGFPMPTGLARLDRAAPALVPWAWGINGFASVLAPPLAMLLAMNWGYITAAAGGLAAYSAAALFVGRLPSTRGTTRTR